MSGRINDRDLPFLLVGPDGTVVEANTSAATAFRSRTLVGTALTDLLPERPDGTPGPLRARRVDGTEFPAIATAIRVGDRLAYAIVDLSDADVVRASFAPSAGLPGRLIDRVDAGIVVQMGAEIVSANAAAARTLGLSLDELLGRTSVDPRWRAVDEAGEPFPGEQHPAMVALRTGEVVHVVMGIHTPGGDLRWLDATSHPFILDEGRTVATFTHFTDITATRRADAARAATLIRYETLLAEASDAVLVVHLDGRVDYASPSAGHTLSRRTDALVGTNVLALAVPDDRPAFAHALEQCAARPAAHVALTVRIESRDAAERWFEVRLRNAVDVPELGAIVATLTDVHERVVAVERLRAVNIELEQRLAERDEEHRVDHELSIATELLGHCDDDLEIQGVVWTAATTVFRGETVTFLRTRPRTRILEAIESTEAAPREVDGDDCWAMRTHRVHESRPPDGLTCAHLVPEDGPSICIPLGLATRPYGLLIVHSDGPAHLAHAGALADRLGPLLARVTPPEG